MCPVRGISGRPASWVGCRRAGFRLLAAGLAVLWVFHPSVDGQEGGETERAAWDETRALIEEWVAPTDFATRERVPDEIRRLGADAVPALVAALDDERTVSAALRLLSPLGFDAGAAVPRFVEILSSEPANDAERAVRLQLLSNVRSMSWVADQLLPAVADLAFGVDDEIRRAAMRTLAGFGEPALGILSSIANDASTPLAHRETAYEQLGFVGDPAFDVLVQALNDVGDARLRSAIAVSLGRIGARALPVLSRLVDDQSVDADVRIAAFRSYVRIQGVNRKKIRRHVHSDLPALRAMAHKRVVPEDDRESYYLALATADPFDANVAHYLTMSSGMEASPSRDAAARSIKRLLREALEARADAEIAWSLARVIQMEVRFTQLQYVRGDAYSSGRRERRDPFESFHTLQEALERGLQDVEASHEVRMPLAIGLAKTRLLLGDWTGMNEALASSGQEPLNLEGRELWTAPPTAWSALSSAWGPCAEEMRSGTSTIRIKAMHDGSPMRGVHVIAWSMPDPNQGGSINSSFGGWKVDTLSHAPYPLPNAWESHQPVGGYGYPAGDRDRTRYVVTDEQGVANIPRLPEGFYKLEYLIPTANLPGPGRDWDLWVIDLDGLAKSAGSYPIDSELLFVPADAVVEVPAMDVRSRYALDVEPWSAVDAERFTLEWPGLGDSDVEYQIRLVLTGPPGSLWDTAADDLAPVATAFESVGRETQWHVGRDGVGELRLVPGNIYTVQVTAIGADGAQLARWGAVPIHVPWTHREAAAPFLVPGVVPDLQRVTEVPPVSVSNWWNTGSQNDGPRTHATAPFLRDRSDAFEWEYVAVVHAWLTWHEGERDQALGQLQELRDSLPAGNVARETAGWLVAQIEAGRAPVKRLTLRADSQD